MESDDDFEHFSAVEAESPSAHSHGRKLKRLKRAADVVSADPLTEQSNEDLSPADMPNSAGSGPTNSVEYTEEEAEEPSDRLQLSGVENGIKDNATDFGSVPMESEKENELLRDLMFDSEDEEINMGEGLREGSMEPIIGAPDERWHDGDLVRPSDTKRKTNEMEKKRNDGMDDDTERIRSTAVVNRRREEKERRGRIRQLHADSQRVLRETRDASFKSIPMVRKPISSVLEKIRQRKLEISKKTTSVKSTNLASRYLDLLDEENVEFNLEDCILQRGENKEVLGSLAKEVVTELIETKIVPDAGPIDEPHDIPDNLSTESFSVQKTREELLSDHQENEIKEDPLTDSPHSPVEELFTPSLLAMKLNFDSAAQFSDDEEDNDKENVNPHLDQDLDLSLPLKDPVKDFLDEEAEEEHDSDDDPFNCKQDEEEEDIEDAEELNGMIATDYLEKPIDNEMRNELHQKWLEQEDAAGMENLLQRIKGGPKQREATSSEEDDQEEEEEEEEGEEFGVTDGLDPRSLAQMNLRKARQTVSEVFTDKDDPYVSSEDEESERILTNQSLSEKMKRQTWLLSPEKDESSREVFSRIKKLNVMPENKRRAKPSALQDLSMARCKMNAFLKRPSFVARGSNSSLPSKNQKTSTVRSFIFSRDDSNSRSTSVPEESFCMVEEDSRPARTPSAKFSSSQNKFCPQTTKFSSESDSTTSLYDILRRPYIKLESCVQDVVDAPAQSIFAAFRIGKRSREGKVVI